MCVVWEFVCVALSSLLCVAINCFPNLTVNAWMLYVNDGRTHRSLADHLGICGGHLLHQHGNTVCRNGPEKSHSDGRWLRRKPFRNGSSSFWISERLHAIQYIGGNLRKKISGQNCLSLKSENAVGSWNSVYFVAVFVCTDCLNNWTMSEPAEHMRNTCDVHFTDAVTVTIASVQIVPGFSDCCANWLAAGSRLPYYIHYQSMNVHDCVMARSHA